MNSAKENNNYGYLDFLFIAFILALGLLLKGWFLDLNSIDIDEPFSIFYAQMEVDDIISALKSGNNPPLYEIGLHYWIKVFGISPFSVRFPSLLFASLNILFIYLLVFRFFNRRVAMTAVLLFVFSNYHLYFSQQARVYSLFCLLTTVSFYLLLLSLEAKRRVWIFVSLFIVYAALAFSHYFGICVIGLQAIFIFTLYRTKTNLVKEYFVLLIALLAVFSFYIPVLLERFNVTAEHGTWLKPVDSIGNLLHLIFLAANQNRYIYLVMMVILYAPSVNYILQQQINHRLKWLLIGVVFCFFLTSYSIFFKIPFIWKLTSLKIYIALFIGSILVAYFYLLYNYKNSLKLIVVGWFVIPYLLFFIISFKIPLFLDRYLLFILPAFYIILSLSLDYLFKEQRFFFAASLLLTLALILTFDMRLSNKRFSKDILAYVKRIETPETKIIVYPEPFKLTFAYHYDSAIFQDYKNLDDLLHKREIFPVYHSGELSDKLNDARHIIYLDESSHTSADKGIYDLLNRSFKLKSNKVFSDSSIVYEFIK